MTRQRFEATFQYAGWSVWLIMWDDAMAQPFYTTQPVVSNCPTLEEAVRFAASMYPNIPLRLTLT